MSQSPYRKADNAQRVRIRIAVVIDREGHYSAFGDSEGRQWPRHDKDEADARKALDHYDSAVGQDPIRHLQFLEIELPAATTTAVNVEARVGAEQPPAVALGGRFDVSGESE